ncbi:Eukaryotic aspartyl protease [Lasiodiplodia theobromae]|uniref:Eukaryotic aspartyl protease n=1 Tax=Lasiodiplodia theobromae TaxID=45133 RepID=UPI0015C33980|nr:Eukaryotic aspartyl protease [Lasiodiplodia theobromae]KAF4541567.1 Eukaryotic aspartyl protease [Lasiodiplodia theobromae]
MPAPVVVHPSEEWDKSDGPWANFALQVGTPPQNVQVHISIAEKETWVVGAGGCNTSMIEPIPDCANSRGELFQPLNSSSWQYASSVWQNEGFFYLSEQLTRDLGTNAMGEYGYESVGLSFRGESGPALNKTVVAAFNATDFVIGQFGVNPNSISFTSENDNSSQLNDQTPSFLSRLHDEGHVPSRSFSFTAGSHARKTSNKNAFGSFIFGGYDSSLKGDNDMSFGFLNNENRELTVGVQSITKDGSTNLLATPILAALDSSQPNIWLPLEACQAFEQAFNLTWNSTAKQYLLDSASHDRLLKENSNVTFRLANNGDFGGENIDIVLPFSAFDLKRRDSTSTFQPYFPLKRAHNDSQASFTSEKSLKLLSILQIALGRAFFQEAYLIADYDKRTFSLSQRRWSDDAQDIVPIPLPPRKPLPDGAIAGIVVGVVMGVGIVVAALIWWFRRRRATIIESRRSSTIKVEPSTPATIESKIFELGEAGNVYIPLQEQQVRVHEMPSTPGAMELDGSGNVYIPPREQQPRVHEMPAEGPMYELAAESLQCELEGTPRPKENPLETK